MLGTGLKLGTGGGLGGLGGIQPSTGLGGSLGGGGLTQQTTGTGLQLGTSGGLRLGGGLGTTGGLGQTSGTGLATGLGGGLGLPLQIGSTPSTGLGLGGIGATGGLNTTGGLSTGTKRGLTSTGTSGVLGGGLNTGSGLRLGGGLATTGGLQLGGQQRTGLGGLGLAQKPVTSGTGLGMFNQQNNQSQQQQMAQKALQAQLTLNAIKPPGPSVFGDERDLVLMQFNWLQACSGTGKGLVNHQGSTQLVDFTPESLVCRFKTICYNRLPTTRNEDGLIALQFKKKCPDVLSQQEAILRSLQDTVTRGVPSTATADHLQVVADSIRPLPDNCTEMTIYILKKSGMLTQRLLATDVHLFFQNAARKSQLESLGVTGVYAKTGFTEENLKLYLQTPPAGISSQMWEQSKKDNPDPLKYIPVPIVGSMALLARMKHQDQESRQQQSRLEILTDEVGQLQQNHTTAIARIAEYKRRLLDLSHRVLRVMVAQEVLRKSGYSVKPEEEQLRIRLEGIQVELDAPLQFKGRLNELMAQLRMQTQVPGAKVDSRYPVDAMLLGDMKQHLAQQQGALSQLVKIIKEDTEDLQCVEEGFEQT